MKFIVSIFFEMQEENESRPLKRLSRDEGLSRSTVVMNSVVKVHGGRRKSEGCDTSSSSSFY